MAVRSRQPRADFKGKSVSSPVVNSGGGSLTLSERFSSIAKSGGSKSTSNMQIRVGGSKSINSRLGVLSATKGKQVGKAGSGDRMAVDNGGAKTPKRRNPRNRNRAANMSAAISNSMVTDDAGTNGSPSKAGAAGASKKRRPMRRRKGKGLANGKVDADTLDKQLESYMMQNPEYAAQYLDNDLGTYMTTAPVDSGSGLNEVAM